VRSAWLRFFFGIFLGLQDGAGFEGGFGRLGVGQAEFAEEVEVGGHDDAGAKVRGGREMRLVGEVVG